MAACSSSKECLNCHHSSVRHFCWWNKVSSKIYSCCLCGSAFHEKMLSLTYHSILDSFKYVATPIQAFGNSDPGRRAMIFLKHKILKSIVLRRTKKGRAADLALPPRIVRFIALWLTPPPPSLSPLFPTPCVFKPFVIFMQVSLRRDTLDIKEQDYYESLYNDSQAQFNTYITFNLFSFSFHIPYTLIFLAIWMLKVQVQFVEV